MKRSKEVIRKILFFIIITFLILATYSLIWAQRYYGNIGLAEIVFTLNMPLKGTAQNFINSYLQEVLFPTIFVETMAYAIYIYVRNKKTFVMEISYKNKWRQLILLSGKNVRSRWYWGILGVWFTYLLFSANNSFQMFDFIEDQIRRSEFIEEEYVDPGEVKLVFPEEKKNLIYIIAESMESSLQGKEDGGIFEENYIPELTALAKENISFSHTDLLEGAAIAPASGWTIAGIVAETAGIPLKLYSTAWEADNGMGNYISFLPGAVTLGDILKKYGYKNYFMQGSDITFAGKDSYFKQHGDYEIWDYSTAIESGKIPEDYYVWWGMEDAKLFQFAKEELLEIAKRNEPFNFTLLTVDTHHPSGYVCELCTDEYSEQYANVYRCASRQIDDFIRWIQQQEFYEKTEIVVVGDHCSMSSEFFNDIGYSKHHGFLERKVYNAFINTGKEMVNEKNRKFTTMDFYPTVLSGLGVEIEGDRLGLGTDLFSETQTLVEEYGYEYVFEELNKKSDFYDQRLLYP